MATDPHASTHRDATALVRRIPGTRPTPSWPIEAVCRAAPRRARTGRQRTRPDPWRERGQDRVSQLLVDRRAAGMQLEEGIAIGRKRSPLMPASRAGAPPCRLGVDVEQHGQVWLERRAHTL